MELVFKIVLEIQKYLFASPFFYLSNFLSYKSAANKTTKTEPALCTNAPVVGFKAPITESIIAKKFIIIERLILIFIVFTVAFESRFK